MKKFIGLPSDLIFQAVKRMRSVLSKSMNAEAIAYARDRDWINDWEKEFYFRIMRKRNLSEKRVAKKRQISEKFLLRMRLARASPAIPHPGRA